MSLLRSGRLHVAAGFLLMGGWAIFANMSHPMPAPLIAGLLQGLLSAAITFTLKRIVDGLLPHLKGVPGLITPSVLCAAFSVSLLAMIHTIAGTPEVWTTLALPSTVGTLYATFYNITLRRSS